MRTRAVAQVVMMMTGASGRGGRAAERGTVRRMGVSADRAEQQPVARQLLRGYSQ